MTHRLGLSQEILDRMIRFGTFSKEDEFQDKSVNVEIANWARDRQIIIRHAFLSNKRTGADADEQL